MLKIPTKRTRKIWLRVNEEEKRRILQNAKINGFGNISEFIRRKILDTDLNIHTKLNEIKQILEGGKND